jgi:outer membrane protein OmpA-like peptidoglycan-associated protein
VNARVSTVARVLAVLPALVFAYPGFGGGKGLFRVQNALVEQEAGLTVSLHTLARNAEFNPSEDAPNSNGWIADLIAPELSYAPISTRHIALELFGSWGVAFQNPKSYFEDDYVWGFRDVKAGGKISVSALPVLKLGGTASYTFKSRETQTGWLDPSALPQATQVAWGGLVTLQFQDLTYPAPNVILNAGKHVDRLTPRENETYFGAAAELQGAGFALFVEAFLLQPDVLPNGRKNNEVLGTKYGHVHLTPGIAIGSPSSAFLKVGYTLSLGGESLGVNQPNELVVGLGYATSLGRQPRRGYGRIEGRVTDAGTGAPLAATITFPDHPQLGTLVADSSAGVFEVEKVPAGAVTVEASASGYESRTVPLMVENHKLAPATIELPRAVASVEVTGRVSDRKTGRALSATVLVPEADSALLNTDPATGIYRLRLMPGAYTLVVESKDYLKQSAWLLVERDNPVVRDFGLVAEWMVITLDGIYFDFDRATIGPESRPALQGAAKILEDNPGISVEIQGHTDDRGSDAYNLRLSERRAQAVVNYLVENLGIKASRLTAKGYGESQPVADNATDDGRAINRRVDFVILGPAGQE